MDERDRRAAGIYPIRVGHRNAERLRYRHTQRGVADGDRSIDRRSFGRNRAALARIDCGQRLPCRDIEVARFDELSDEVVAAAVTAQAIEALVPDQQIVAVTARNPVAI